MELIPEVKAQEVPLMGIRYVEVRRLGAGNFGDALLVIDNTPKLFSASDPDDDETDKSRQPTYRVVKRFQKSIFNLDPKSIAESRAEIKNLARFTHPNVVRFYHAWFDVDNHLHMLMEHCECGDLEDLVRERFPLPELLVRSLFYQLVLGLDTIHHSHILHRDIKSRNIFLTKAFVGVPPNSSEFSKSHLTDTTKKSQKVDSDKFEPRARPFLVVDRKGYAIIPKIGDFGLSKALKSTEEKANTVAGTPYHFSPEIVNRLPYSRKSDVWSLGVLMFYVITQSMPFRGRTVVDVYSSIMQKETPHPATRYLEKHKCAIPYSEALMNVIVAMLNKSESCRPATEDILEFTYFGGTIMAPKAPTTDDPKKKSMRITQQHQQQQQLQEKGSLYRDAHNADKITNVRAATPTKFFPFIRKMSLARQDAKVNVRAEPSTDAPIIGIIVFEDIVEVIGSVDNNNDGSQWWQIVKPFAGFCISTHKGKVLFVLKRSGHDPMRLSPLKQRLVVKDKVSMPTTKGEIIHSNLTTCAPSTTTTVDVSTEKGLDGLMANSSGDEDDVFRSQVEEWGSADFDELISDRNENQKHSWEGDDAASSLFALSTDSTNLFTLMHEPDNLSILTEENLAQAPPLLLHHQKDVASAKAPLHQRLRPTKGCREGTPPKSNGIASVRPPRIASPIATRIRESGAGTGHISPIRNRSSPNVQLPKALAAAGGTPPYRGHNVGRAGYLVGKKSPLTKRVN